MSRNETAQTMDSPSPFDRHRCVDTGAPSHAEPRSEFAGSGPGPRRVSLLRCLLLACMLASAGAAFAANPVTISLAVQGLAGAQTPRLIDDTLILSCKPAHSARFVGARFANEDWEVLHPYSRNENGVFVLDYAVPEGVREIRYRVEVDGLWMSDPTSARTETDAQGNRMSVFTLDREPPRTIANPKREPGGAVSFTFRGAPGKRVTIMGDFNGWDPFANPLAESEPGTYRIALRVRPGSHWYVFYSAGRRILDAYNTETGTDPDGSTVSYFSLFP